MFVLNTFFANKLLIWYKFHHYKPATLKSVAVAVFRNRLLGGPWTDLALVLHKKIPRESAKTTTKSVLRREMQRRTLPHNKGKSFCSCLRAGNG